MTASGVHVIGSESADAEASPPARRLRDAVRGYLDHLAVERGLAANTVLSYRRDLRRYGDHLLAAGVSELDQVGETNVAAFLSGF